jgi:tRNA 2-thiocytidine biosynthesis protein TtcA
MTTDRERQLSRCEGRLLGKLRRTARRWPVLPEGARLALAISGGVDSLAMAYLVGRHNRRLKDPLDLVALHVCLDTHGVTTGLPEPIKSWLDSSGLSLIEIEPRLESPEVDQLECFACAKIRRRTLLEAGEGCGASHVALGHHADDVVETWLMSLLYTGNAEAIPPVREYFGGAVTIVRPLYELKKGELVRLARLADLPEAAPGCTMEALAKRDKVQGALRALGRDQTLVRRQLFWAAVNQIESGKGD